MQELVRGTQQGSKLKFSLVLTLKCMTSRQSFNSLSCGSPLSLISKSRSCFSWSGGCHSHTWRFSNNLRLMGYPPEPGIERMWSMDGSSGSSQRSGSRRALTARPHFTTQRATRATQRPLGQVKSPSYNCMVKDFLEWNDRYATRVATLNKNRVNQAKARGWDNTRDVLDGTNKSKKGWQPKEPVVHLNNQVHLVWLEHGFWGRAKQ